MTYRTECWRAVEIAFESAAAYRNPFLDVDLACEFVSESGRTIRLLGYWDGGRTWKVRFAPTETGTWRFRTACTNPADAGLHGREGAVESRPYAGPHELYRRGFLAVAPDRRHLAYADGTPFFWLGDTHWTFTSEERFDESNDPRHPSQFRACVDRRVAQRFTVYQCNFRDGRDFHAFGRYDEYLLETEAGLLPDVAFLQRNPDPKMAYLADAGLVIAAGLSWGGAILAEGRTERYRRLAKYLVARYGAYPVVWTLAGEVPGYAGGDEEREMADRWREVALETEKWDGYGALQSVHLATDRPFPGVYAGEPWYDFAMSQAGHGDLPISASMYAEFRGLHPDLPLVESESLYEGIRSIEENGPRTVTPAMLRRVAYLAMQNGACGYTYGACGVWELQWDAAPPGGFWAGWGSLKWSDGLDLPGARQMTILRDFYERVGWHRLTPVPTLVSTLVRFKNPLLQERLRPSVTADEEMRTVVGYFDGPSWVPVQLRNLAAARYRARWFDPETGAYEALEDARPEGGRWVVPPRPGAGDRLLVLEAAE